MKHVVILGGGFAGVAAGLELEKQVKEKKIKVTVVDKNPYHLFTPTLFEVAVSAQTEQNVVLPYNTILNKHFNFAQNAVEKIAPDEKKVYLKKKEVLPYDYLIIALGSQPAYYNIPGLQENSISFKSLKQAVEIKNKVKELCCKEGKCNRQVKVVVGGGGFSGTELAAELLNYKNRLAKENDLPKECLDLTIIQGSDKLLKELGGNVSDIAAKRLNFPNVHLAFGGHIKEVTKTQVLTDDGKSYAYDILIWTGGIEANHVAKNSGLPTNKRGQIIVDDYMRVQGYDNIYAAGDITEYLEPKTQKPVPAVAQVAEDQGKTAAENILRTMEGKSLKPYHFFHYGYVVPLRGHYSVANLIYGIHLQGISGWALQQLVFLRYLLGIMPLPKALLRWGKFEMDMKL